MCDNLDMIDVCMYMNIINYMYIFHWWCVNCDTGVPACVTLGDI